MPNRPWKEEEVLLLKDLYERKKKLVVTGRSPKSIRRKLISLGLEKPIYKVRFHKKNPWTNKEMEILKKGKNPPNRTKESIRSMKVRLGLVKQRKNSRRPWKKKHEKILLSLVKQKKSAKEIFGMNVLPYSKNSIQKKMCYMGFAKKRTKKTIKLSLEEKQILKKFLLESYEGKTPDDLVAIWNDKPYFKVNRSRVLYYLHYLKIKIPYYEVAKINNLRKKEQSIKSVTHKSQKELEENIRLARANFMKERLSQGRDIWTGMECKEAQESLI